MGYLPHPAAGPCLAIGECRRRPKLWCGEEGQGHRVIPHGAVPAQPAKSLRKQYEPNMKTILTLASTITLLSTTGCLVEEGGDHDHGKYEHHSAVIVGPPVVEVRPPVVIVR